MRVGEVRAEREREEEREDALSERRHFGKRGFAGCRWYGVVCLGLLSSTDRCVEHER